MIYIRNNTFIWSAALLILCALGCGGSEDGASASAEGGPAAPSPETPPNLPDIGVPQGGTSESSVLPRVRFETTKGDFVVELRSDLVPRTVQNFLNLVDNKFYDETIFHQVIPGYAVVGGNYVVQGDEMRLKDPGTQRLTNEAASGLKNGRGTIAMARDSQDADSAQCQFFINLDDNVNLDYVPAEEGEPKWETIGYCAFGVVVEGMDDVVKKIGDVPVTSRNDMDGVPVEPVVIRSVRRL